MTEEQAREIIIGKKREFGTRLVILGHHYQNDSIIEFADYVGDSLELAGKSASLIDAEVIIFCGVYFMAETAAILSPGKKVYIPDKSAGCPLADMAELEDVERAWREISCRPAAPVTYVNSSALIKAFCGRNDGIVCTSGNAKKVFKWALDKKGRVFFMPDMNLGRNTAYGLGIKDSDIAVWDPESGLDSEVLNDAKVILWKGWCPVHYPVFTAEDVERFRVQNPGGRVIVHPETDPAVAGASDSAASTAGIIEYVNTIEKGGKIAVGTESNMVKRLAGKKDDVRVVTLREAYCEDMAKITLDKLAACISGLSEDYRVMVPEHIAQDARAALKRMLEV
ncbi:MAG TPA: quinolinate synthase NadA [Desulfomonilia bacterium]